MWPAAASCRFYVAAAAREMGENPFIVRLRDDSSFDWSGFDNAVISVGDVAGLGRLLRENRVDRVVLSGGVARRPEWREIRPTIGIVLKLPSIVRTLLSGGDDTVLQMVIKIIGTLGARVIGAHEIAPGLLATTGVLGTQKPTDEDFRDIRKAADAALALGTLDVGQGRSLSVAALWPLRASRARMPCWRVSRRCALKGVYRPVAGGAGQALQTTTGCARRPADNRH